MSFHPDPPLVSTGYKGLGLTATNPKSPKTNKCQPVQGVVVTRCPTLTVLNDFPD
jgi:hypothetical protein